MQFLLREWQQPAPGVESIRISGVPLEILTSPENSGYFQLCWRDEIRKSDHNHIPKHLRIGGVCSWKLYKSSVVESIFWSRNSRVLRRTHTSLPNHPSVYRGFRHPTRDSLCRCFGWVSFLSGEVEQCNHRDRTMNFIATAHFWLMGFGQSWHRTQTYRFRCPIWCQCRLVASQRQALSLINFSSGIISSTCTELGTNFVRLNPPSLHKDDTSGTNSTLSFSVLMSDFNRSST